MSGCSTLSFTFFIACSIIPGCSDLTFSMQISVFHADFLMRLWRYWQLLNVSASTVKPWYNGYNKLSDITNSYVHSTNIVLKDVALYYECKGSDSHNFFSLELSVNLHKFTTHCWVLAERLDVHYLCWEHLNCGRVHVVIHICTGLSYLVINTHAPYRTEK